MRHYTTEMQDELDVNYCHLAAVSVDAPDVSGALRAGLGSRFPFLCDPDRRIIRELDIVDLTDKKHGPIAIPYTFALGPDLTIHNVYNGWWYVGRPTAEELRHDLRAMMEKYRSDYHYVAPAELAREEELHARRVPHGRPARAVPGRRDVSDRRR